MNERKMVLLLWTTTVVNVGAVVGGMGAQSQLLCLGLLFLQFNNNNYYY